MPEDAVKDAIGEAKPDYVLLFLVHYDLPDEIRTYLERLAKSFTGERIFVTGNAELLQALKVVKKTTLLRSPGDLDAQLRA